MTEAPPVDGVYVTLRVTPERVTILAWLRVKVAASVKPRSILESHIDPDPDLPRSAYGVEVHVPRCSVPSIHPPLRQSQDSGHGTLRSR